MLLSCSCLDKFYPHGEELRMDLLNFLHFSSCLYRNTCRGLPDPLSASFPKPFEHFCWSRWKPEESMILMQQQTMSSASERAIYLRSVHIDWTMGFLSIWLQNVLLHLHKYTTFTFAFFPHQILSPEDEWYKAEMNGQEGFVPQNYIEMQTPRWETLTWKGVCYCIWDDLQFNPHSSTNPPDSGCMNV